MRIKEVEKIVGISSHNIRFYEKVNLIEPTRNIINGYREYSECNIEQLMVIKRLRELGISIENIRGLLEDESKLNEVIQKHLQSLELSITRSEQVKKVCNQIIHHDCQSLDDVIKVDAFKHLENTKSVPKILGEDIFGLLPESIKLKYYEAILTDERIEENVLDDLTTYINHVVVNAFSNEKTVKNLIKHSKGDTKTKIIELLKEHNRELFHNINRYIYDIEEVMTVPEDIVKTSLGVLNRGEILIALKGVSPQVQNKIMKLYEEPQLYDDLKKMNPIPLSDVLEVHEKIISKINTSIDEFSF